MQKGVYRRFQCTSSAVRRTDVHHDELDRDVADRDKLQDACSAADTPNDGVGDELVNLVIPQQCL